MTAEERQRIDQLIADIAGWRIEMKDDLLKAVQEHQDRCLAERLDPMDRKLDKLIEETERDSADRAAMRRLRKRVNLSAAALLTIVGTATPFILHYL